VGSVFCSARSVVRKEVSRAEAPAVVGEESVVQGQGGGQGQGQGEKKDVEVEDKDEDENKAGEVAATQAEDKSHPDLPAEAETGEGVVQKEDSTTVSDPAAESGIDTQAGTPNAASAEPTVSSAADSTPEGTEAATDTGILGAANSAVAAVSETVETVKEALSAEVPVGGVAGLESEKPAVVSEGEDTKTENENLGREVEIKAEAAEEPVQAEQEEEEPSYTICIVSNKYNTNNFW
jgi:hypothetical protein